MARHLQLVPICLKSEWGWCLVHSEVARDPGAYEGRHRAIRDHAFVQYRGDDRWGCGRPEDDEPDVRCGFYREHHPTMAGAR